MNSDSASVLIVGIDSQIGDYLGTSLALQGYMVTGSSRRIVANERQQKDIIFIDLNLNSLELPNRQFDVAIICAGMNMAMCKEYPVESERINVKNTIQLIDMLLSKGIHVIFFPLIQYLMGARRFISIRILQALQATMECINFKSKNSCKLMKEMLQF